MSYTIIFETKIVLLSDGRILHLDRSGCNNDDAGRDLWDFRGKIYTPEDFTAWANSFKEGSSPYKRGGAFDMKIGSRDASNYDYGEHLLRMLKRAKPYAEFIQERPVQVAYCASIKLMQPEQKILSLKEFNEVFYQLLRSGKPFRYHRMMCQPNIANEQEVIRLLEEDKPLEFYVGPLYSSTIGGGSK